MKEHESVGELVWTVTPEGFESGIIAVVERIRGFLILYSEKNKRLMAHFRDVVAPAGHYCIFADGMEVVFRRYYDPSRQREVAADVNLNKQTAPFPDTEISEVVKIFATYCVGRRECGCEIMVPGAVFGSDEIPPIGTKIRHRRIETGSNVRATAVEMLNAAA